MARQNYLSSFLVLYFGTIRQLQMKDPNLYTNFFGLSECEAFIGLQNKDMILTSIYRIFSKC